MAVAFPFVALSFGIEVMSLDRADRRIASTAIPFEREHKVRRAPWSAGILAGTGCAKSAIPNVRGQYRFAGPSSLV